MRAGSAFVEFYANDTALKQSMSRIRRQFGELQGHFRTLATAGVATAIAATPAVAAFTSFDDAIRAAGARAQATGKDFDAMRQKALDLGASTSFTATQVANVMSELGTAGFKPDQINAMTGAVLDLSRATGTDAARSAEILGATINAFQLKAEDATRVADAMTKAANASAITVEDLGESFKYAGPIAADFGVSMEDTLALVGGLGNMGIRGEMAGTAIRRIGQLIAKEEEKLRKYGVTGRDAAGDFRPMVDVLEDLRVAMSGMGNAERAVALEDIFGLQGITGASAIGKSATSIRDLAAAIRDSKGEARRTAQEMDAGLGGSFRRLMGSVEGAAIALGESMAPALGVLAVLTTQGIRNARDWINGNKELAAGIAAVVVALAALLLSSVGILGIAKAVGLVSAAFGILVALVKMAVAALGLLLSPLAAAIAAVVLLARHWLTATDNGKAAANELTHAFEHIGEIFHETFEGVAAAVKSGDLQLAFAILAEGIKAVWYRMLSAMGKAFAQFVKDNHDRLVTLGSILGGIKGGLVGSRFGPLGTVLGIGVGAAGGGLGANEIAKMLEGFGHNPGVDAAAAAAAAEARLRELTEQARKAAAAPGGGGGPGGPDPEEVRIAKEMAKHRMQLFDAAKGSFSTPVAQQQFGYGDKVGGVADRQLKVQQKIDKNTEDTVKQLVALSSLFRLG